MLRGPHSITELARELGVTQQAASKTIAEMQKLGYVEDAGSEDARVRKMQLSARGRRSVEAAREIRRALDEEISDALGSRAVKAAKHALIATIDQLGARDAIRARKVRAPR